jgi:hypothetical protein
MNPQEVGWGGMGSTALAQNRDWWRDLVNVVMNFRFPYNAENFFIS